MLPRRLKPAKKGCGFANYLVYEQFDLPFSNSGLYNSSVRGLATDDKGVWIIAFGYPRAIYFRSEDNGDTWVELSINNAPNFAPPYLTMDDHPDGDKYTPCGIVADGKGHWKSFGSDRKIYASNDDGKTWNEEYNLQSLLPLSTNDEFINAFLRTDNNGVWFAVGTIDKTPGKYQTTLRSLDNGASWQLYEGKYPTQFRVFSICSDKNGLWHGCDGSTSTAVKMCKSSNNGETWQSVEIFPYDGDGDEQNHDFGSMAASINGTVVAIFNGKEFKSPGDEWEPVLTRETVAKSDDYGDTWEIVYPDIDTGSSAPPLDMVTDNNGFWMATDVTGSYEFPDDPDSLNKTPICSYDDGKTWFAGPGGFTIGAKVRNEIVYGNNRFIVGRKSGKRTESADSIYRLDYLSKSKQFITGYGSCHEATYIKPPVDQPDVPIVTDCDTRMDRMLFDVFYIYEDRTYETLEGIKYAGGTWIALSYDYPKQKNIYRSTDKGETWTKTADLPYNVYQTSLESNGKGKWMINGAAVSESYVSNDDGLTWQYKKNEILSYYAGKTHMVCDRRTDQTPTWFIFGNTEIAKYARDHSFISTDDGETWNPIVLPDDVTSTYVGINSISYVGNGKWSATFTDDGSSPNGGIYSSSDGGLTFHLVYNNDTGFNRTYSRFIENDGKGTVIQLGQFNSITDDAFYVFRSTDYGETWTGINNFGRYANAATNFLLLSTDREGLWYTINTFNNTFMSVDNGISWQAAPSYFGLHDHGYVVNLDYYMDYGDGRFIVTARPNGRVGGQTWHDCSKSRI